MIFAHESLLQSLFSESFYLPVSSILRAVICPVSSLPLGIQEELLFFFSLCRFLLVSMEWQGPPYMGIRNWKSNPDVFQVPVLTSYFDIIRELQL